MFIKWIIKRFFPSSEVEKAQAAHDPQEIVDKAHESKKKAKIAMIKLDQASSVAERIMKENGFAEFFKYPHDHIDEERDEEEEKEK